MEAPPAPPNTADELRKQISDEMFSNYTVSLKFWTCATRMPCYEVHWHYRGCVAIVSLFVAIALAAFLYAVTKCFNCFHSIRWLLVVSLCLSVFEESRCGLSRFSAPLARLAI